MSFLLNQVQETHSHFPLLICGITVNKVREVMSWRKLIISLTLPPSFSSGSCTHMKIEFLDTLFVNLACSLLSFSTQSFYEQGCSRRAPMKIGMVDCFPSDLMLPCASYSKHVFSV